MARLWSVLCVGAVWRWRGQGPGPGGCGRRLVVARLVRPRPRSHGTITHHHPAPVSRHPPPHTAAPATMASLYPRSVLDIRQPAERLHHRPDRVRPPDDVRSDRDVLLHPDLRLRPELLRPLHREVAAGSGLGLRGHWRSLHDR